MHIHIYIYIYIYIYISIYVCVYTCAKAEPAHRQRLEANALGWFRSHEHTRAAKELKFGL